MKTKPVMDSTAAFPEAAHQPTEADLKKALGRAAAPVEQVLASLRAGHSAVTTEWRFSERSGWYLLPLLKKRRLFYLVPKRDNFQVSLILGDKAIDLLQRGPFARRTTELLKTAKRWPEGTAFSFDRQTLDPDLIAAFVAAKIAP